MGGGSTRAAKLEVPALCLGNALGACGSNTIPLWFAATTKSGLVSLADVGWLGSGELLAIAISVLGVSALGARAGPRALAASAAALITFANLLAMWPSIHTLIIGRLFSGVGLGGLLACVTGVAARRADVHRVFALMQAGVVALLTVVFAISPHLVGRFGAAGLFGLLAALSLLMLVAALAGFPAAASVASVAPPRTHTLKPAPILGCLAWALVAIGQCTIWSYIVAIGNAVGLEDRTIGNVLGLIFPITALGPLAAHWLGERCGLMRPLLLGLSVMTVDVYALVTLRSPILFCVEAAVLPMAMLFCAPYAMALLSRLDLTGRSASAAVAFLMIGSSVGPALGGRLAGDSRFQALASVAAACFVLGIGLFLIAGQMKSTAPAI